MSLKGGKRISVGICIDEQGVCGCVPGAGLDAAGVRHLVLQGVGPGGRPGGHRRVVVEAISETRINKTEKGGRGSSPTRSRSPSRKRFYAG